MRYVGKTGPDYPGYFGNGSGYYDSWIWKCPACGNDYTPGEDGTPQDESTCPACPACGSDDMVVVFKDGACI